MTTFPEPSTLKRKLDMSAPGSKKEKQGERKKKKRVGNAQLQEVALLPVAPLDGDHTGSRATEWLTEFDQRGHTCMIEACFYVAV